MGYRQSDLMHWTQKARLLVLEKVRQIFREEGEAILDDAVLENTIIWRLELELGCTHKKGQEYFDIIYREFENKRKKKGELTEKDKDDLKALGHVYDVDEK